MTEPIVYKSSQAYTYRGTAKRLKKSTKYGFSWEWNYSEAFAPFDSWRKIDNCAFLSWKFEWDEKEMQKNGVYGFEGIITVRNDKSDNSAIPLRFKIILAKSGECIKKRIGTVDEVAFAANNSNRCFKFEFTLNKITEPIADVSHTSEFNDAILVVEGVKIDVNKTYLSIRSDYFNTLFNSDFKEKSMDEIPIEDVKYEEFRRLLDLIHPTNPTDPTDNNVRILLELADRFIMPAVTTHVERYLLSNNNLPFNELLELADKFELEKLLDQCVTMLSTTEHVKNFNSKDGLSWEWNYCEAFAPFDLWRKIDNCAFMSWKFSWDEQEMRKNGVYGFGGEITVRNVKMDTSTIPLRFKVILIESGECIKKRIGTVDEILEWSPVDSSRCFQLEFTLNKITEPFNVLYQNFGFNDAVLVVDGVNINVNKNNLAMCSDYFNTLFNSEFKEKSMDDIPIEDVKYKDFARLLGVIHPTIPTHPTDNSVEILLELADRFMMPVVTSHVEHHLLNNSELPFKDILMLADKFRLEKLVDQCMFMLSTSALLQRFKTFGKFSELSDSTKGKLFDKFMTIS